MYIVLQIEQHISNNTLDILTTESKALVRLHFEFYQIHSVHLIIEKGTKVFQMLIGN